MGTDEVRVADPAVVDGLARLHRSLQLLDHVAFLDQVVLDGDAGDLAERTGEGLGLVLVGGDGFGDHRDLLDAFGLELGRSVDEPLELGRLLGLAQGRWLELAVDPSLGGGLVGPGRQRGPRRDERSERRVSQFHAVSLDVDVPPRQRIDTAPGKRRSGRWKTCSALAHDQGKPEHRDHETDPHRRLLREAKSLGDPSGQADEGEVDVGRAEQADEEPVTSRGLHGQKALAFDRGRADLPHRHADEHQHDDGEEDRHRQGPDHPGKHHTLPMAKPLAM